MPERVGKREIIRIKRDKLKLDDIRKNHDEEELRRLGKSIKKKQWHPLVIRSDGTIIDGNRRVMAGDLEGVEEYDCIVIDEEVTRTQARVAQAVTAIHRKGLGGFEQFTIAQELLQINLDWTDRRLAAELDLTESMMVRVMSVAKVAKPVRDALEADLIGLSDCYAISKEKDAAKQLGLLELKVKGGASRDEIERVRRNGGTKNWNGSSCKNAKVTLVLESGKAVTFICVKSVEELIHSAKEVIKAGEDAKKKGWDLKYLESKMQRPPKGNAEPEVVSG